MGSEGKDASEVDLCHRRGKDRDGVQGRGGTKAGPPRSPTSPHPGRAPHSHPPTPALAVLDFRLCHKNRTFPPPAVTLESPRPASGRSLLIATCVHPPLPRPGNRGAPGLTGLEPWPHVIGGKSSSQLRARSLWGGAVSVSFLLVSFSDLVVAGLGHGQQPLVERGCVACIAH